MQEADKIDPSSLISAVASADVFYTTLLAGTWTVISEGSKVIICIPYHDLDSRPFPTYCRAINTGSLMSGTASDETNRRGWSSTCF